MFIHDNLPIFIVKDTSNLAFCDVLRWRKTRTCLALTKQLKLYEFAGKQTLHCFDLRQTVLRTEYNRLQIYKGPKTKSLFKHNVFTDDKFAGEDRNESLSELKSSDLHFGRYIFRNRELYIVLQCWDKLLILKHPEKKLSVDYSLVAEYTDVAGYQLIHDKVKYRALVKIVFKNGQTLCTDFQDNSNAMKAAAARTDIANAAPSNEFKRLLKRVTSTRSELLLHRVMTQRDFVRMSDNQNFGSAANWTPTLAEKQRLTRCGDIWLRITVHDVLVIGVPLLNNTAAVVRQLKPVFQLDAPYAQCHGINYEQRVFEKYQHVKINGDELSQFFDCLDESRVAFNWHESNAQQVTAESSIVLVLNIPLADIINQTQIQLFLYYETQMPSKFAGSAEQKQTFKIIPQQLYLRCLNIAELLHKRKAYAITFNDMCLQQDLLAVLMSQAAHCVLQFVYINKRDCVHLTQLLIEHLQFELCGDSQPTDMPVDASSCMTATQAKLYYYNRQPMSEWYGTLVVRELCVEDCVCICKIYAQNNFKLKLMLRMLFESLLQHKSDLSDVQLSTLVDTTNHLVATMHLEHALRRELDAWRQYYAISKKECSKPTNLELNQLQLASDLFAATVIDTTT